MLNLCIAGVGRMGQAIIHEAVAKGHQISGAIEAPNCPVVGKTLRELGVCNSDTKLLSSEQIREALAKTQTYSSPSLYQPPT